MSGHSKWSTIKRQKGAADIKRGLTFTKIGNTIALAARSGGSGDFETNPRLRLALEAARAANMPKENIQRAIDRGLGKLPGQSFEEVFYEGFGPGKVAFIVEGVTDNKNRTLADIKNIFDRGGGALGSLGSVSYMFDKVGEIKLTTKVQDKDEEILQLIDLGAVEVEDFMEDDKQKYLIYTTPNSLGEVGKKITQEGFRIDSQELTYKPNTFVEISNKELAEKVLQFSERIEDHDDVQKVYSNFDIPDELLPL